ncbi:MAG: type II toxin-antitoxin system Phd/YefM family antitoxin [Desulfurispora sp.]|uniref:type II toxin-antitoxin system Phd/YefM family antitoxin n=1 Tax=Desulfurispora sp. TaxID=3014275 RepID=UPI004049F66B
MQQVNIHEAKTHFSRLIARVLAGEEIIIARAGQPVARLLPVAGSTRQRTPGSARGQIKLAADFHHPLPDHLREEFEK